MSLDTLLLDLQSHLSNGRLSINPSIVASANLTPFLLSHDFSAAVGGAEFVVTQVQSIDRSSDHIHISGNTTLFGLQQVESSIMFLQVNGRIVLVIGADLTAHWLSRPNASSRIHNHPVQLWSDVARTLFQDDIKNQHCNLLLASADCHVAPLNLYVKEGIQVSWTDDLGNSALSEAASYLDGQLTYNLQLPKTYSFGHISMEGVTVAAVVQMALGANVKMPGIKLAGRLTSAGVSIDVEGRFNLHDGSIVFNSHSSPLRINRNHLQKLLNINDLRSLAPDVLQSSPTLTVNELRIALNPFNHSIDSLVLELAIDTTWSFIPNFPALEQIKLHVNMRDLLSTTQRKIAVYIEGKATIANTAFEFTARAPSYEFSGKLSKGETIKCKPLLSQLLPDISVSDLPDLDISRLELNLSPHRQSYRVGATVNTTWGITVGAAQCRLQNIGIDLAVEDADVVNGNLSENYNAAIQGTLSLAGHDFVLQGRLPELAFNGYMLNNTDLPVLLLLQELLDTPITLPNEISQLQINRPCFSVSPRENTFFISGLCKNLAILTLGFVRFNLISVNCSLAREKISANQYQHKMNIGAEAQLQAGNQLLNSQFTIDYTDRDNNWILSGNLSLSTNSNLDLFSLVNALLPSTAKLPASLLTITLNQAALNYNFSHQTLTLSADTNSAIILDGIGALRVTQLSINVYKNDNDPSEMFWNVQVSGTLSLSNQIELEGVVNCYSDQRGTGIEFNPSSQASLIISLPIPNRQPLVSVQIEMGTLAFVETANGIHIDGETSLRFLNLPEFFDDKIADSITGRFSLDGQSARIGIDQLFNDFVFTLPSIPISDALNSSGSTELGDMLINLTQIELILDDTVAATAILTVGLPSKLNNVFGFDQQGRARADIFNCYEANHTDSVIRLPLKISDQGVSIGLLDSPFNFIEFEAINDETWCKLDFSDFSLGDIGAMRCRVPEFSFDASSSSFKASGAFEIIRPLKLPLRFLKTFLLNSDQQQLADILPEAIELKTVDLLNNGQLDTDALINHLETVTGERISLNRESRNALKNFEGIVDRLPQRLKNYFSISVPDRIDFSISVTLDGGVLIDLSTAGDPIKVLFCNPINLLVLGIELRGFSFGEILGGQLFLVKADVDLDYFDPLSLAAATLTSASSIIGLPDTRDLCNRVIIRKLTTLISYQSSFPIPVPIFFDELGIETKGIHGFELQSHARFPQPELNLKEFLLLASELSRFCSDKDYLLSPSQSLTSIDPRFTLGANFVQLPEYLGSGLLGTKQDAASISAYEMIAILLNGLKTLNAATLINTIPMSDRSGARSIQFFQLSSEVFWLISSDSEFSRTGRDTLRISVAERKRIQQLLESDNADSIRLYMAGEGRIANLFSLKTQFVCSLDEAAGVQTGFDLKGSFANNLVRLTITGKLSSSNEAPLVVSGKTQLTFLGEQVLNGTVALNNNGLKLSGDINLLPRHSLLNINGKVTGEINDSELRLVGGVRFRLGSQFSLQQASLTVTHNDVSITGKFLNQVIILNASQQGRRLAFSAAMSPVAVASIFRLTGPSNLGGPLLQLSSGATGQEKLTLTGSVTLLSITAPAELELTPLGYQFSVEGKLFDRAAACLRVVTSTNLLQARNFVVNATLKPEFLSLLAGDVARQLQVSILQTQSDLDDLLNTTANKKSSLDTINQQLRNKLKQLRQTLSSAKRNAETEVQRIEGILSHLEQELEIVKNRISSDNTAASAKVRQEKNKLKNLNRKINSLTKRINYLKSKLSSIPTTSIPSYLAEIAMKESEIATQLTLKTTAAAALTIAEAAANSSALLGRATIDAAQQKINVTKSDLRVANSTLSKAINDLNQVTNHAEIEALNSQKKVLQLAYNAAKDIANQFKQANRSLLNATNVISRHGVDALVSIKSASFSAKLTAVNSGKVDLVLRYKLTGKPVSTIQLRFDFYHTDISIKDISHQLLNIMTGVA